LLTAELGNTRRLAMSEHAYRWIFRLFLTWGAIIFWLAPHPPMIDLPQHAGQVILFRDMLTGQSSWSELFRINWMTPYIIGYGLAVPLSFLMPVAAALKLLLSIAYVAFVLMCVKLRQHFGADSRLDWLFLLSFFGFAYKWGFFTFLLAAPIGLWFILLADKYAINRTVSRAVGLIVVGLVLLASHGLTFLFSIGVGGALLLAHFHHWSLRHLKTFIKAAAPYAVLLVACAAYFMVSRQVNTGMETELSEITTWHGGLERIPKALIYSLATNHEDPALGLFAPAVLILLATPWLLGLRIDWKKRSTWVPFALLMLLFIFVPSFAFGTAFLYQRFALFLLPAYAWMFTKHASAPARLSFRPGLVMAVLVLACLSILSLNTVRVWRFGQETAGIDSIVDNLEPRQRVLSLVFAPNSEADKNRIYTHYAAWYQAEKQGLVDFNFAWFPPQIVRYRPERLPGARPGFEWHPERFDWVDNRGGDYTYFFVRHDGAVPANLFRGASCQPRPLFRKGSWTVFERGNCS